jgi:hypothetical protein
MFWAPVVALLGIVNVATTVPAVASVLLVLVILPPSTTLVMGALAGGFGGELGSVMVTVTVWPRLALPPGATEVVEKTVVPALS